MSLKAACIAVVVPALVLASAKSAPPEKVQLTIATLHAAALVSPRAEGDSTDAPFFAFQVIGRHGGSASILADHGKRTVRQDEQLGARPLTQVSLSDGDSVEVLVSVLERKEMPTAGALNLAAPPAASLTSSREKVTLATRLAAPLVKDGARVLGSVSLLLTNEGGAVYWRRLDCVVSCKVLSAPAAAALATSAEQSRNSVVELSGNGATYHLALRATREP